MSVFQEIVLSVAIALCALALSKVIWSMLAVGAAAGESQAHHRIGRQAVVETAGHADRARGHIVAADHRLIAAVAVAAAIGAPQSMPSGGRPPHHKSGTVNAARCIIRFAPKATELLRRRAMTRYVKSDHSASLNDEA